MLIKWILSHFVDLQLKLDTEREEKNLIKEQMKETEVGKDLLKTVLCEMINRWSLVKVTT